MVNRRSPLFWTGLALLAGFAAIAAFAQVLAPYDPRLPAGQPLTPPDRSHWLGTNDLGQDVLSQLLCGTRWAIIVAGLVATISTALSWAVGLTAGFFRRVETPLMMVTDLLLALPGIPLYILILTLAGPSRTNIVLTLSLLSWPAFARIVRSLVISARTAPYVEASRALGAGEARILWRHLLPVTLDVLPAKIVLTVRFAIFAGATLAFLGLGGDEISWGTMLNWAFADPLLFARPVWPWLVLPPAISIAALILATAWVSTSVPVLPARRRQRRAVSPRRPRL